MKSAILLSKTNSLYDILEYRLQRLYNPNRNAPYGLVGRSIRVEPEAGFPLFLFDREDEPDFFERHEIPEEALAAGYRYGYLVECRSETVFCAVIRYIASDIDILICDNDASLFRPDQLDPNTISL